MYTVTQLTPLPLYVAFWYLVSTVHVVSASSLHLPSFPRSLAYLLAYLLACLLGAECDDESPATGGMVLLGSYLLHLYNH